MRTYLAFKVGGNAGGIPDTSGAKARGVVQSQYLAPMRGDTVTLLTVTPF